jgi:hypothetical protein
MYRGKVIGIIFLNLFMFSSFIGASEPETKRLYSAEEYIKMVENFIKLDLIIQADKKEYIQYEPIRIKAILSNSTEEEIDIVAELRAASGYGKYYIEYPDKTTKIYKDIYHLSMIPKIITLKPQETYETIVSIFYGTDGFYFEDIGEYKIWGKYYNRVVSEKIKIKIKKPYLRTDKELVKYFKQRWMGNFLHLDGGGDQEPEVERIIKKYKGRKSVYLGYAKLSLAFSYSIGRRGPYEGGRRPPKPTRAIELLKDAIEEIPPGYHNEVAFGALFNRYLEIGNRKSAAEVKNIYYNKYKEPRFEVDIEKIWRKNNEK